MYYKITFLAIMDFLYASIKLHDITTINDNKITKNNS